MERGQVADLVQEDAALAGQLHQALAVLVGPGERSAHVPEQRALEQGLRNGRAVHRHEGRVPPRPRLVQGPGHQLLARARLPQQQHGQIRGGQRLDIVEDGPHGPAHGHDAMLGDESLHQLEVVGTPLLGQLQNVLAGLLQPVVAQLQLAAEVQRLPGQPTRLPGQALRPAQASLLGQDGGEVAAQLVAAGQVLGLVKEDPRLVGPVQVRQQRAHVDLHAQPALGIVARQVAGPLQVPRGLRGLSRGEGRHRQVEADVPFQQRLAEAHRQLQRQPQLLPGLAVLPAARVQGTQQVADLHLLLGLLEAVPRQHCPVELDGGPGLAQVLGGQAGVEQGLEADGPPLRPVALLPHFAVQVEIEVAGLAGLAAAQQGVPPTAASAAGGRRGRRAAPGPGESSPGPWQNDAPAGLSRRTAAPMCCAGSRSTAVTLGWLVREYGGMRGGGARGISHSPNMPSLSLVLETRTRDSYSYPSLDIRSR
jgi:hypothetical protein